MHDPRRFRRQLAARLLALVGAAALGAPDTSCSDEIDSATSSKGATTGPGSGGAAATGSVASTASASSTGAATATGGATSTGTTGATGTGGAASTGTGGATSTGGATGTGGIGGVGGAGGAGGAGGSTDPPVTACFPWPIDGGPLGACPTDPFEVLAVFESFNCPKGFEPGQIVSATTSSSPDLCCYLVVNVVCGPGGRPYRVDERARLAALERGAGSNGWSRSTTGPSLDGLTAEERAALARVWTAAALSEHASVASFARFSLELLAVGAPADLVERAHEAALDEIRHAQLAFALAGAYAGEEIAPGPFPVGEVRAGGSLVELAVATALDGCVGETVAAVVASEQLARATDPAVQAALAQIADDEARHAELAWATVAWAARAGGREVRAAVERALLGRLGGASDAAQGATGRPRAVEGHGWLDAATLEGITAGALAEVVGPSARALG